MGSSRSVNSESVAANDVGFGTVSLIGAEVADGSEWSVGSELMPGSNEHPDPATKTTAENPIKVTRQRGITKSSRFVERMHHHNVKGMRETSRPHIHTYDVASTVR